MMRPSRPVRQGVLGAWLAALALCGAGCSTSDLFVPLEQRVPVVDNKIRVRTSFCAEPSSTLEGAQKLLFVVDRSNSMNVTDPNNRRVSAVRDFIMRFVQDPVTYRLRPGIEIGLISFYGDVVVHTRNARGLPGFTRDGAHLLASLMQVARTSSNTSYDKALAQAFVLLDRDLAQQNERARARSRYDVVFVSDGMPFPDNCRGESNSPTAALRAVERIHGLSDLYSVPVIVHTAFASDPRMFITGNDVDACTDSDPIEAQYNDSLGQETAGLLKKMADAGGGSFRQFRNGDSISFADFEVADARRSYDLASFLAANENALPHGDHAAADSDGDGKSDVDELRLGTRPTLADTDGDGFSDLVEWRLRASGFDPLDPSDGRCPEAERGDTDGDGLRDCEEILLGTSRTSVDSDNDGIPDPVEVRAGTDARSVSAAQDSFIDTDADGAGDADEARWHTDPLVDDVAGRSLIAYDYTQRPEPRVDGQACYDVEVGNISLGSSLAALPFESVAPLAKQAGWNRIMLYFAERPFDDPLGEALYRFGCVEARFVEERDLKMPAGGVLDLPARRPSATWRPTGVLRPNDSPCQASVNQDCGLGSLWCRIEETGACNCYWPPTAIGDPSDGTYAGPCPACSNGRDDDGDGKTDYPDDPDCFDGLDSDEGPSAACSNGIDDDGDGKVDWPYDPGCTSAYDTSEDDPVVRPACADGIDNDNDGAIDFPADVGCDFAADDDESQSILSPAFACSDGIDNDGDGLIDMADRGCSDPFDVSEDGPDVCFFCERSSDNRPGQCDLAAGYCKPLRGPARGGGACTSMRDCRGAACVAGVCSPCLRPADCDTKPGAGDGVCDPTRGWCLTPRYAAAPCAADSDCKDQGEGAHCLTGLGVCSVDPHFACRDERDCRADEVCSARRGFCLRRVFATEQCDESAGCAAGACDLESNWCLPVVEDERCRSNDDCPRGTCLPSGACDQATFVGPEEFRAELDCWRAR